MQTPRLKACQTLVRQEKDGYSNLVLASSLQNYEASPRDKAFVSALFYGTLEKIFTIDAILAQHLTKPLLRLDAEVRAILRMGLYQAKYMQSVPLSAAINESVKLAKQMKKTSAAGFINAVLRKAVNFDIYSLKFADTEERISILCNVSKPIAKIFINVFGNDAEDELNHYLDTDLTPVRVNVCLNDTLSMQNTLQEENWQISSGEIPNSLYIKAVGNITDVILFKNGFFHVQGIASQLACSALSPKKGEKVLDLCAAPGGKSVTLAQYMENEGQLICADAAENRLSLIEDALKRCKITCASVVHQDASEFNEAFALADKVLCDVPCSGLGIIAKKPDIRIKNLENIDQLVILQKNILNNAAKYVKKGGRLVYSTCTINCDENEEVVNSFLSMNKDFKAVDFNKYNIPHINKGKFALFTPKISKTDGFFVATLERL